MIEFGRLMFAMGLFLVLILGVLGFVGRDRFWSEILVGIVFTLGSLISVSLLIPGVIILFKFYLNIEIVLFMLVSFALVLCGGAIFEFVFGIIQLKNGVGSLRYERQVDCLEMKMHLTNEVQELKIEQEKILNKWKHSAYCPKSKDKTETKNEAETSDEDAYKK